MKDLSWANCAPLSEPTIHGTNNRVINCYKDSRNKFRKTFLKNERKRRERKEL